ncbi:LON peptidase N-terminal domain and RING finger protein 1 [Anolis carolinensis]|nr:PREDICTED: LON peptidase N-terminal domain and RING finger protein 1 [Anolis carolinensis]|eukprot:XP_008114548.1 PREDICTED: LON peptidase N-terminal domain and RING finger protein 1 [Anolis carolinensis]
MCACVRLPACLPVFKRRKKDAGERLPCGWESGSWGPGHAHASAGPPRFPRRLRTAMELFRCPSCRLLLWEPATAPCGHSFCRRCLAGAAGLPGKCPLCGERLPARALAPAVLLGHLLEKCCHPGAKAERLRAEAGQLLRSRDYRAALSALHRGIAVDLHDPVLRLWRSEAYVALQQYPEALEDLEVLCRQEPEMCEGFLRKGKVLLEMGKQSEALLQFQHCLTLNSNFHAAQHEIERISTNDASPLPGTVVELKSDVSQSLKGSNSGKELALLAPFEEESLQNLKNKRETFLEELGTDDNEATYTVPECLRKTSVSGFSIKKEEDLEEGTSTDTTRVKSTWDVQPDFRDLLSTSDLECSLCIRLFFEPVTTPCGHTFCKECVERCLDHRPNCPLCKQSLREYLRAGKYNITVLLEELMKAVFPSQLAERKLIHQAEMAELSNLTKNIPIFVCTMSFPGILCPLHVFEPRYRLMMRRCQETGTKMFGMCMYENGKSFADYGCMLEIQKIVFLPDGRSFVDTVGKRRFRVLRRGHRDGYNTADIEYLEDEKVEGEELAELQSLHDYTYLLTQRFYEYGDATFRQLLAHHGPLPEKEEDIQAFPDGPVWCWWLISILPLDLNRKLTIFSDTSLKARLTQLKHILNVILENRDCSS